MDEIGVTAAEWIGETADVASITKPDVFIQEPFLLLRDLYFGPLQA